jgi:hypothetical protein
VGPRAVREKGHEREGNRCRQAWPTEQRKGERERERACVRGRGRSLAGGVHLSGDAGARACGLATPSWANWAEKSFSFSREFLIAFLFIFSRVFNSKSNQVSNSN